MPTTSNKRRAARPAWSAAGGNQQARRRVPSWRFFQHRTHTKEAERATQQGREGGTTHAAYCSSRMLAGPPRGAAAQGGPGTSTAQATGSGGEAVETGVGPPSVAGVAAAMVTTTALSRVWPGHTRDWRAAIDEAPASREVSTWMSVGSAGLYNHVLSSLRAIGPVHNCHVSLATWAGINAKVPPPRPRRAGPHLFGLASVPRPTSILR